MSFRMPISPSAAIRLQGRLRERIVTQGAVRPRLIAGADVSYRGSVARAAIVVLRDMHPLEEVVVVQRVGFPYIPGLLSFREIPPLLRAWRKLRTHPDVIIVDGHGIAHPRRMGLASHLGLLLDVPTIGCAKSRLCGEHAEPPAKRGGWSPLRFKGETVGAALRTQDGRNVVYVSSGHRIGLRNAISVVLSSAERYRLPEPQRWADRLTKQ